MSEDESDNVVEISLQDQENLSFEEQLQAKMDKFSKPKPIEMTTSQAQKALRKEMDIFEATGEKSTNLKNLYEAL